MRRALLLLILLLSLGACSGGNAKSTQLEAVAAAFDPASLDPAELAAWQRLRAADFFGSATNTWTWGPQEPAADVCLLWHEGERDALLELTFHATPSGRLWGLWGLKYVDPPAYEQMARVLRLDEAVVHCVDGCFGSDRTVSEEIARTIESGKDGIESWGERLYPDLRPASR